MHPFLLTFRGLGREHLYWSQHSIDRLRAWDTVYIAFAIIDASVGMYVYPHVLAYSVMNLIVAALQLALLSMPKVEVYNQHRVSIVVAIRIYRLVLMYYLVRDCLDVGFDRSLFEGLFMGPYLASLTLGHQLPFVFQMPLQIMSIIPMTVAVKHYVAEMWVIPGLMSGGRHPSAVSNLYHQLKALLFTLLPTWSMEATNFAPSECPVQQGCTVQLFSIPFLGAVLPLYMAWLIERSGKRAFIAKVIARQPHYILHDRITITVVVRHVAFLWAAAALTFFLLEDVLQYCSEAVPCSPAQSQP